MALRLGLKLSGVASNASGPVNIQRQLKSLSPITKVNLHSDPYKSASGSIAADERSNHIKIKNAKTGIKNYSSTSFKGMENERERTFINSFDSAEQYELEAAKPRYKIRRRNEVYKSMSRLQKKQLSRVLPHLQPSNLKPYGSTDNIVFPEILKPREWVKYPENEAEAEEEEYSVQHENTYHKDGMLNRREFSTYNKPPEKSEKNTEDKTASEFDLSDNLKLRNDVPVPSYSDRLNKINHLKPYQGVRQLSTQSTSLNASTYNFKSKSVPEINVGIISNTLPLLDKSPDINIAKIKEPIAKVNIKKDPSSKVNIADPISVLNEIEFKKSGRGRTKVRKPKEVWDQYCPEEEPPIPKKCPLHINAKLPKLIPKDCPCIDPPPPCDVPPLPRLNLEVCEPRPLCEVEICGEGAPRADIDCWEYVEDADADCRKIPAVKDRTCDKKKMRELKCKHCNQKRFSTYTGALVNTIRKMSTSSNWHMNKNNKVLFSIQKKNFSCNSGALDNSSKLEVNYINLYRNYQESANRYYSWKKCPKTEEEDWGCPKKDKPCKAPKIKRSDDCKGDLCGSHPKPCPRFCLDNCPLVDPDACFRKRHAVCCERTPKTPYPSYSECMVSYIQPFTNTTEYKCERCGRNPRDEENIGNKSKKYSTNSVSNSLLMSNLVENTLKGKRLFSNVIVKSSLLENSFKSNNATTEQVRYKNCKTCPDISYPDCPPRCRFDCEKVVKDLKCVKQKPPYPAFSECVIEEFEEFMSECPYNLESSRRLQPDFQQVPGFDNIIKPPPYSYDKLDPHKEERCIKKKLCLKNEGITQDCCTFGKPYTPLKSKHLTRNDYPQCVAKDRPFGYGQKFVVKLHTMPVQTISRTCEVPNVNARYIHSSSRLEIEINSRFTSKIHNVHSTYFCDCLLKRCFITTTLKCLPRGGSKKKNPKICPPEVAEAEDCDDKPPINEKGCFKTKAPIASFSEAPQETLETKISECPNTPYQEERADKIKSQFNIPGISSESKHVSDCKPVEKKYNDLGFCDSSETMSILNRGGAIVEEPPAKSECKVDKCVDNVIETCSENRSIKQCDNDTSTFEDICKETPKKSMLGTLVSNIVNYFKARDCPSPEEFKRMRLRAIAERAANRAGLTICEPKDACKTYNMPKIITPESDPECKEDSKKRNC